LLTKYKICAILARFYVRQNRQQGTSNTDRSPIRGHPQQNLSLRKLYFNHLGRWTRRAINFRRNSSSINQS
ncbi:MAG TPA: hypothetical protein VFW94_01020, partial [Candidatus Acidoferrales bacterium]|nr:hypothetical protein [Candidatus Acidoferrales bacterium]